MLGKKKERKKERRKKGKKGKSRVGKGKGEGNFCNSKICKLFLNTDIYTKLANIYK